MLEASDQLVPVYFRREHVAQAYALAAQLDTQVAQFDPQPTRSSAPGPAATSKGEPLAPGWTADEIRRAYLESPKGMMLLFDGMIDHPDETLDANDLAGFLTHKPNADAVVVRGTMGAFANRCGMRYQKKKRSVPFEHWYVDGGFARYRMSRPVADLLRELRDAS
jgi:hypothetical protein